MAEKRFDEQVNTDGLSMPLLSVIVPVYNAEKTVERCVSSILKQTYAPLELLLVDDGSTDGSYALLQGVAAQDERVRVFRKENGGAASARNLGIEEARGAFFGFIDADDTIEPDMYERMMRAALSLPAERREKTFIQIGRFEEDEAGQRLPDDVTPPDADTLTDAQTCMKELLLNRGDASLCTKLTPAALLKEKRFPEGRLGEDFGLLMDLLPKSEGVLRLAARGYHVLHRIGSATRKSGSEYSKAYEDILFYADRVESETVPAYPALRDYAVRFGLYERMEYLLHVPIEQMTKDNPVYTDAVRYLKTHRRERRSTPHLTAKNKLYLLLFTYIPRLTRKVHRALRR